MSQQQSYTGTPFSEFIHPDFGKLSVIMIDNEPWFIPGELEGILGLVDIGRSIDSQIKKEDTFRITRKYIQCTFSEDAIKDFPAEIPTKGLRLINEPALYRIVLRCRKPQAEAFQDWVTHEVLPTIRQNGHYVEPTPDDWSSLTPKQLKLRHEHAMKLMKRAYEDLEDMDGYARFGYTVAMNEGDVTVEQFSKLMADEFKVGRNRMYQFLRDEGYLLDVKVYYKWNMPKQTELEAGRMSLLPVADRNEKIYMIPMITLKGAKFYHDKLEESLGRKRQIKTDSKEPVMLNLSAASISNIQNDGFMHLRPTKIFFDRMKKLHG